ncbi:hypothetical protein [Endozoicomonas sp. 4G]|uniref:hypothetical protein n=1 Tax=Endozoicomonas sp. 4G TaxID=2872754 RepID=UPI002078C9E4|nr:hypothetical protein [Endozoicomonas sp. 4G]
MAKKSVGQKRREKELKRKRKQKAPKNSVQYELHDNDSGKQKLSSLLLDYASPLLDMIGDSKEDIEAVIAIASVCWNIGNYPEVMSREFEDGFISNMLYDLALPEDLEEGLPLFLSLMINGRRTIFSEDPRYVMDYELLWVGGEYRLRVFSSLVPPEMFEDVTKQSFEEVKAELIEKQEIKI